MKQYAMYLRKSRADLELESLGQGETLTRHRTMLMDLASRMDVLPEQITEYKEVVSGESIASRPEMQKLLNAVYLKKFTGVFVVEVERLARGNTKDQGEVADAFQYSNTLIITPTKVYNPSNEFDQEYFEFGLFMSRREYKTIKRRMEAGRIQSVHEGNYVGSLRPYGYDIKRINKKERILVINEDEAPIVKMIFNWFTEDQKSPGWIARELTRRSIPTLTGKTSEWNRGTIVDMLHNSHYIGNVRWCRRKSTKEFDVETGQLSKHKRRLTPNEFEEYPGKHKPIITTEQFQKASMLFKGAVPVPFDHAVVNPLSGLLVCSKCGKTLVMKKYHLADGSSVFRFQHPQAINCHTKSVSAPIIMEALSDALKAYIENFQIKLSEGNEFDNSQTDMIDILERELAKQERKKARLFDSWESDDGTYTKDEFIQRKQIYSETIDNIKSQIAELKKAPAKPDYEEKIITLHAVIDCMKDDETSAKAKNDFLKSIIDRIEYDCIDYGKNKGCQPIMDVFLK